MSSQTVPTTPTGAHPVLVGHVKPGQLVEAEPGNRHSWAHVIGRRDCAGDPGCPQVGRCVALDLVTPTYHNTIGWRHFSAADELLVAEEHGDQAAERTAPLGPVLAVAEWRIARGWEVTRSADTTVTQLFAFMNDLDGVREQLRARLEARGHKVAQVLVSADGGLVTAYGPAPADDFVADRARDLDPAAAEIAAEAEADRLAAADDAAAYARVDAERTEPLGPVLLTATYAGRWTADPDPRTTLPDGFDAELSRPYRSDTGRVAALLRSALESGGDEVAEVLVSVDGLVVTAYGPYVEPVPAPVDDPETIAAEAGAEVLACEGTHEQAMETYHRVLAEQRAGTSLDAAPKLPTTRAEVLQLLVDAVSDGLPVPTCINLWDHHQAFDFSFHRSDASAGNISAWSDRLGIAQPSYGSVLERDDTAPYRALQASGRIGDFAVRLTAFIDVSDDSTGLEGTGWLDEVWVAAERKGVTAHRPTTVRAGDDQDDPDAPEMTACDRSMRTGTRTTAAQATQQWGASFGCRRCWPDGSPITSTTDSES